MSNDEAWRYDEFRQVGKDYDSDAEVDVYDSTHADFRDLAAEADRAIEMLGLKRGDTVIDFGCGTGTFAIRAAQLGVEVHAVDVSETMLAKARGKASDAGASSIRFHHAGFLTYTHTGAPVSAISTSLSFHHLPDYWKGVALKRLAEMLVDGGRLYLHDVIIEEPNAVANINKLIEHQAKLGGDFLREDAEIHFREEFSTYDWIMDGLLTRAGFKILQKQFEAGLMGTYLCEKFVE